ncbi:hypothetical protein LEP1GSC024_0883 [Leptospira noguchii str. 2001034031]|uniref:N-acetyltransferase domain-containing protein n=2 Tax=Leptospira noguchii TaxID=28182 RepID=M6YH00_9LEPT|nr:hypothetical protein LEP1GSC024_0883 [Leptospira noguchii str. 2001034031]
MEILESVKSFCKNIYKEAGYSEYEAVNLDYWSKWFYVTYDGEIQAASRLVEKTKENLIPLEIVKRYPSGDNYLIQNLKVADWNSVCFKETIIGFRAFKITAKYLAKYCLLHKYKMVYGMINPTWKGLHRVYCDYGALHSSIFSDLVYYPGCYLNNELALFKIIEIKENALQKIASNV